MKTTLFAAGLALLMAGPACASWAENAQMRNPVYTGTNRSLAAAQRRGYHHHYRHVVRRGSETVGQTYR